MTNRYYLKLSDGTVCFIDSQLDMNLFKEDLNKNKWVVVADEDSSYLYGKDGEVFEKLYKRDVQVCNITSISQCNITQIYFYEKKNRYKIRYNLLKEIYSYELNWWYKFLLNMQGLPKNINNVDEVEWLWISTLETTLKKVKKRSKGKLI